MAKKPKAPKLQEATPKLGGAFAGQQYFYNQKGEVVDQTGAIQTPVQLAKIKPFLNEYDPNYGKVAPKPVRQRQIRRPIQPAPAPVTPPPPPPPAEEPVATAEIESTQPSTVSETPPETTQNEKPGLVRRAAGAVRRNAKPFAKFAGRKFLQSSFPDLYNLHQEYQAYKKKNRNKNLDDQENKTKADNESSEDKRTQADIKAGLDLTNTLMKDSLYLIRQSLSNEERITTLLSEISSTLSQIKWLLILKGGIPSLGGLATTALASAATSAALMAVPLLAATSLANTTTPEEDKKLEVEKNNSDAVKNKYGKELVEAARAEFQPWYARTSIEASDSHDEEYVQKYLQKHPEKKPAGVAYAAGTPPVTPQGPVAPRNALAELNQTKNITAAKENTLEKNNHVSVESDDMLFKSSKITFDTQKFTLDAKSVEAIKNDNQNNRESQGATPAVPGGGSTPPSAGSETTPGGGGGGSGSGSGSGGSGPQAAGGGPQGTTPQPANSAPSSTTPGATGTPTPAGAPAGGAPTPGAGGKYDEAGLIAIMKQVGATDEEAKVFAKIAIRESGGIPTAHNDDSSTGDDSYGLWQINMIGRMGPDRLKRLGINDPKELLDPLVNAKAALMLKRGQMGPGPAGWKPWRSRRGDNSMLPREDGSTRQQTAPSATPGPSSENNDPSATPGPSSENNDPLQQLRQQRQNLAELRDTGFARTRAFADGTEDNGTFFRREYDTNPQASVDSIQQQRQTVAELRDSGHRRFAEGTPKIDPLDAARGVAGIAARHTPIVGNVLSGLSALRNGLSGNYKGMIGDAASAFTPFGLGGIVTDQVIPDSINRKPQENIKPTPGAMPRPKKQEPRLPRESAKAAIQQQQRDPQLTLPPSRMSKLNKTKNPSAMHDQNIQRSYRVHDPAGKISKEIGF